MSPERAGGVWTQEPAMRQDTTFEGPRGTERGGAK
jgi:hypothetical protein